MNDLSDGGDADADKIHVMNEFLHRAGRVTGRCSGQEAQQREITICAGWTDTQSFRTCGGTRYPLAPPLTPPTSTASFHRTYMYYQSIDNAEICFFRDADLRPSRGPGTEPT